LLDEWMSSEDGEDGKDRGLFGLDEPKPESVVDVVGLR
jgi:hypothetical protein